MVKLLGDNSVSLLRKAVYGLVGNRAGVEFLEFFKMCAAFDDILEMMTNPEIPVKIPPEADRRYALCSAMSYMLWRGNTVDDERSRLA